MRHFLLFLFCCTVLYVDAQDLTGIWRGNFYNTSGRQPGLLDQGERYKFEVQLGQEKKAFTGVTYSYQTTVFYGKATCKGTINPLTKKVLLEEMKLVEVRMSSINEACIMTCFLQYSKIGEEEFLEGTYNSMNVKDSSNCGRGTIYLRKVVNSDFYEEPFLANRKKSAPPTAKPDTEKLVTIKPLVKPQTPTSKTADNTPKKQPNTIVQNKPAPKKAAPAPANAPTTSQLPIINPQTNLAIVPIDTVKAEKPAPAIAIVPKVLTARENELVKTIVTDANEITVNIYDNGAIDHDTVSVYLDKKLVLSRKMLTYKPLTVTFKLDDDVSYHELVLVAENLGDIPPNTSLMVVKAGNKEYEVRITSTEQKNAVVIFKYERAGKK